MRVRIGRNLLRFNLPGEMGKEERIKFEQKMLPAFDQLKEKYGGQVYSLTPDFGGLGANPNLISKEEHQKLVDTHVMFKDMDAYPVSILLVDLFNMVPHYVSRGCKSTPRSPVPQKCWDLF